jgi:hypothetical protein
MSDSSCIVSRFIPKFRKRCNDIPRLSSPPVYECGGYSFRDWSEREWWEVDYLDSTEEAE